MSDYESHSGKLRLVQPKENESFDELSKRLWIKEAQNGDDYTEQDYTDGALFGDYYEKYVNDNDERIYEIFEHEDEGDEDTFCRITDNKDGTLSFHTRFYNGGTCLSEMLEEAVSEFKDI